MKTIITIVVGILAAACGNTPQPVANSNTAASTQRPERMETVTAHSTENRTPPAASNAPGSKAKWTQSGDPIDTKELDAAVEAALKTQKTKPADVAAKKILAEAYLKRAVALTDARQYASALGDYRRALKYDPENPEAKNWIEQIVGIYEGLGREAPKEGEEPPPLPFKPEAEKK